MGFKCGIVGLPNVGKSTLFNALTNAAAAAANYPFCTIDPNVGVVPVPDARLHAIAGLVNPAQVIPAQMEFVDIAGLVDGASRGEGLGNQFLGHIRETQAIAQVVRCFEDDNVAHISGNVDPVRDVEVVGTELCLADQETVDRAIQRAEKAAKTGAKDAQPRLALLERVAAHLDGGLPVRALDIDAGDREHIAELHLLTAKPVLYIANVAEGEIDGNPRLDALCGHLRAEGAEAVPVCAALEAEIARLAEKDKFEFLAAMGLEEPGLNRIIRAGYRLLGLHTFFTYTSAEARAWTLPVGASAVEAAGTIHTDFARGFIRAEVVAYEDFIRCGGEQGAKEAGKWRLEGRDYAVRDGDVMLFRFNV